MKARSVPLDYNPATSGSVSFLLVSIDVHRSRKHSLRKCFCSLSCFSKTEHNPAVRSPPTTSNSWWFHHLHIAFMQRMLGAVNGLFVTSIKIYISLLLLFGFFCLWNRKLLILCPANKALIGSVWSISEYLNSWSLDQSRESQLSGLMWSAGSCRVWHTLVFVCLQCPFKHCGPRHEVICEVLQSASLRLILPGTCFISHIHV